MSSQTEWTTTAEETPTGCRWARWSLWMLPAFVVWIIAYTVIARVLDRVLGEDPLRGDALLVQGLLPWLGLTALWVLPLAIGIGLALYALARAAGRRGWIALALNAVALLLVLTPAVVDRIGPPTL